MELPKDPMMLFSVINMKFGIAILRLMNFVKIWM